MVIPAHDEAASIGPNLTALLDGLDPTEVEVVVVCNGCTDDTAARARAVSADITVLELEEASKVGALRAGDAVATSWPRVYLDADVTAHGESIRRLLAELSSDGALSARPPVSYDTPRSSWAVRRYYAARERLDGVMGDLCAAGVYGLSEGGRARFGEFPDLVADDLFVARAVGDARMEIVDADPIVVHVPRTARAQLRVLKRVQWGNAELAAARPDLARSTTGGTVRDLLASVRGLGPAIDAAVYAAFAVAGRLAARADRRPERWERDHTTRS